MTLLNMSIYGGIIILAVLVIRAFTLHRLPKKVFLVLWAVALLRLLVPFEISSGFSLYSLFPERATAYTPEISADPFETYSDFLPNQSTEHMVSAKDESGLMQLPFATPGLAADYLSPIDTEAQTALENTIRHPVSNDFPLFPVLWAVGALCCAAFFFITYKKCHIEFCASLPVTKAYADYWLKNHPLKRSIDIRQSDKISAPLTYGIFHPVILLPKKTDWENTEQLDYVLYHEFTHIRRFDLVAKLVMIAALCLHWFHPFVWIMYYFFNRDLELSCDECVVSHFEKANASYARTLIAMEERKNYSAPLCNHFSKNAIEERITAIMKMQKVTLGAILIGILLITVVTVTLTTSPKETNAGTGPSPLPTVTATPTPTPDPGPTATPPPTVTPLPTPPPGITSMPLTDGTYSALVKGCTETSLILDIVEIDFNSNGSFTDGYILYHPDSATAEFKIAENLLIQLVDPDSNSGYTETSSFPVFLNHIITEYGWSKMPYFFKIEAGEITGIYEITLP